MAHVFISYKREDIAEARRVRQALRAERYTVWWDEDVQGGQQWNAEIDAALLGAAVVVVLWSEKSVASDWVKHEASIAQSRGVLVPVTIRQCTLPLSLASVQSIDLVDWDGSESAPKFSEFLRALAQLVSRRKRRKAIRRSYALIAALLGFVAGAFTSWQLSSPEASRTAPAASTMPSAVPQSELAIARELERLVEEGEYQQAIKLFEPLYASHKSGVGYAAYPEAAFAFDRLAMPNEAVRVLDLLHDRIMEDTRRGYGYLAHDRAPREALRADCEKLRPRFSQTARERVDAIVSLLSQ